MANGKVPSLTWYSIAVGSMELMIKGGNEGTGLQPLPDLRVMQLTN